MSDVENDIPKKHFTEFLTIAAIDSYAKVCSCRRCGAAMIITEGDRKNGIHPLAIHVQWHDNMDGSMEALSELIDGTSPVESAHISENLKAFEDETKSPPIQGAPPKPGPRPQKPASTGTNAAE